MSMIANIAPKMSYQPLKTASHELCKEVINGKDPATGRAVKQSNSTLIDSLIDFFNNIRNAFSNWWQQLFSQKPIEEHHDIKQLPSNDKLSPNINAITESVIKAVSEKTAETHPQLISMTGSLEDKEGVQSAVAVQMAEDDLELEASIYSDPKKQAKQFGDFLFRPLFQTENEDKNGKDRHIFTDLNNLANKAFVATDFPAEFMNFVKECASILQALKKNKSIQMQI